jgi:uncharacterized damage-inducible protein DinB
MALSKGAQLAEDLANFNAEVTALVEGCPDDLWQQKTGEEGWTVAATAHHIAEGHYSVVGLAQLAAAGKELPELTWDDINHGNAEHASAYAACTKDEVLATLAKNGTATIEFVRDLDDATLANSVYVGLIDQDLNAEQIIRGFVLQSGSGHLNSLRETLGA